MINKYISLKNAIIDAITMLGLDHDKDYPTFATWAVDAEKQIGAKIQLERKHAVLDIKGCAAELPCDAIYLERALMGDCGCDCDNLFNTYFGTANFSNTLYQGQTQGFYIVDVPSSTGPADGAMVSYQVQDNKIIFDKNYDGNKVTIQYRGTKTDCDGYPMIGQNHKEAITAYIVWKWNMVALNKKQSGPGLGAVQMFEEQWHRLCRRARGDDNNLTESDKIEISDMLHDPYSGRSVSTGMRTTLDWWSPMFI